jgi:hypothetical protein
MASRLWSCVECWERPKSVIGYGIERSPTMYADLLDQPDGPRPSEIRGVFRPETDGHEVGRNGL